MEKERRKERSKGAGGKKGRCERAPYRSEGIKRLTDVKDWVLKDQMKG